MKNKFGKRALSLLLSALMVVTSVPFAAVTATAANGDTLFHYEFGQTNYVDTNNPSPNTTNNSGYTKDSDDSSSTYYIGLKQ